MTRCRAVLLVLVVAVLAASVLMTACGDIRGLKSGNINASERNTALSGVVGLSSTTVTISYPTPDQIVENTTVTVYWNGTNNGAGINYYSISLDSNPAINVGTSNSYTFNDLGQSQHTVVVTVYDSVFNTNLASVTFFIDVSAPSIEITSPAMGSYLNTTSVNIEWVGSDQGMGITHYDIQLDSNPVVPLGFVTSWTFDSLGETQHNVEVIAYDGSGKIASDTVSFYVDSLPPTISILSPDNGHAFNQSGATLSWKGGDIWSGLVHYEVWLNGVLLFNASSDSTSCVFGELKDGTYSATIRAIDQAKNVAEASISFIVDTASPAVSITSPRDDSYTNQSSILVQWSGNGTGSSVVYQYSIDSSPFTNAGAATSHLFGSLGSGHHTVRIKALDAAGNEATEEVAFTIDLAAPALIIDTPEENALFNTSYVPISWTGIDLTMDHYEVMIDNGGWADIGLVHNFTATELSNGSHIVQIKAFDLGGNVNLSAVHFTVDLVAPRVIDHGPQNEDVAVATSLTATFSEAMNSSSIVMKINGVECAGSLSGDIYTFEPESNLHFATTYTVTVSGKDLAGNGLQYQWSFTTTDVGMIVGRVLNNAGSPVAGANVTLDTGEWNLTNESGYFVIHAHAGPHNITVSYPGLGSQKMKVVLEAGATKQVGNIQIAPEGISLGWIVAVVALIVVSFLVYFNYQKRKQKPGLRKMNLLGRTKKPSFALRKPKASQKKNQHKPPEDEF